MITNGMINGIAKEAIVSEERWLSFWMENKLPPIVLRWIKERKHLGTVARYLSRKGFYIQCYPNGLKKLMQGSKQIAEHHLVIHGKRIS